MGKQMVNELKQGWLSPTGEFFECSSYNHMALAHELSDPLGLPDIDPKTLRRIYDDDKLLNAGWVSIGINTYLCHEWIIAWKRTLTPEQKQFLRPYFEESEEVYGIPVNMCICTLWEEENR